MIIFSNGHDENGFAIQTRDGCYLLGSITDGWGGYNSQGNCGFYDFWVAKFCDTTLTLNANFVSVQSICSGTCIDFTNLSQSATSFQWNFPGGVPDTSTAITPQNICYGIAGNYDVQLIATNTNGSDTLLISNYITVLSPLAQSIIQSGDSLIAIAGAVNYQWYFNSNIISGATDYFYVATQSGDYNVVATDTNGCEVEAVLNNVIAYAQLAVGSEQFAIFPNPVSEQFTMHNSQFKMEAADDISIYNLMGEKVISVCCGPRLNQSVGQVSTVDCRLLPPGMYSLEIISPEKIYRSKFIKQ